MNKYEEILSMFVNKEKSQKGHWLAEPFTVGTATCASDKYSMVIIDGYISNKPSQKHYDKFSEINGFIENCIQNHNLHFPISYSRLKTEYEKNVPLIDEIKFITASIQCPECDGDGELTWECEGKNGGSRSKEDDCPFCNGTGFKDKSRKESTGNKMYDLSKFCQILGTVFYSKEISKLLKTMELLECDETILCNALPDAPSYFSLGNHGVVLMPVSQAQLEYSDNYGTVEICFSINEEKANQ